MTNFTIFPLANCPRLFVPTTFLRSRLRAALARIDAWERKINRNRCRRRRGWPILQDRHDFRDLCTTIPLRGGQSFTENGVGRSWSADGGGGEWSEVWDGTSSSKHTIFGPNGRSSL